MPFTSLWKEGSDEGFLAHWLHVRVRVTTWLPKGSMVSTSLRVTYILAGMAGVRLQS